MTALSHNIFIHVGNNLRYLPHGPLEKSLLDVLLNEYPPQQIQLYILPTHYSIKNQLREKPCYLQSSPFGSILESNYAVQKDAKLRALFQTFVITPTKQ